MPTSGRSTAARCRTPWRRGAPARVSGASGGEPSGDSPHPDIVVIRFPSAAAAGDWFASPAYQALIPLREQAAEVLLLAYEE